MAFLETHLFSNALNVAVTVNVLMPESNQGIGISAQGSAEPPRVLYLLHGYSDDHSIWMRRTSVERYCASRNLAVIMPAVNHSFYANELEGERYWDYVSDELPSMMQRMFRLSDAPGSALVAGLSMGGYGAMKLALTFPERYAAAGTFSGAMDVEATMRAFPEREALRRAFGSAEQFHGSENDLYVLMKQHANAPHRPRIFAACGTKDFLFAQNQAFPPAMRACGWDVTYEETPGYGHEWAYWDLMLQKFLDFALGEEA